MSQLLSIGELLIDFTPEGYSSKGTLMFGRHPGGAPANVAVQASKLGVSSGFIGKVGDDMFGRFLGNTLVRNNVDTKNLIFDKYTATTLAFVELSKSGDRSFSFYRNPGADTQLKFEEIDLAEVDKCKMLCYGSLLMTNEPSYSALIKTLTYAKIKHKITAYDPNWRPLLWKDEPTGLSALHAGIEYADILKISEEELALLSGEDSLEKGADYLLSQGPSLIVITLGAKGCAVFTGRFSFSLPTYDTKVVDTTGSGDSFLGAFLAYIIKSEKHPKDLSENELKCYADFANAAGAMCASKKGAIPALCDEQQIRSCMKNVPLLR